MAAKKTSKTSKKTPQKRIRNVDQSTPRLTDTFKFGDSYTSLILGIVVVIIVVILLIAFIRGRNAANNEGEQATSSTNTQESEEKTYIVQSGDDLWHIAEDELGSGYEWVTIAEENNLTNPDVLEEGTKLTLPTIDEPQQTASTTAVPTRSQSREEEEIEGDSYTVQEGDHLWGIATRSYGDGYRWVDIARANNIANPNIIYPETKLTLPRS